jgi:DUF4097 and DUF4098 domain-containing protein YvlB
MIKQSDEAKATLGGDVLSFEKKEKHLDIYQQNGALHIKLDLNATFPNFSTDFKLTVGLPRTSGLDMKIFHTSGNIKMEAQQLGEVIISSISGNTEILGCAGESIKVEKISGQTQISNAEFGSIDAVCKSGDIRVEDSYANLKVRNTSGSINIKDVTGSIDIDMTSGSAIVDLAQKDLAPIDISATSGNIILNLNKDAAFDLSAKTTSGSIYTGFDVSISGNLLSLFIGRNVSGTCNGGGENINIVVVSGKIDINKKYL